MLRSVIAFSRPTSFTIARVSATRFAHISAPTITDLPNRWINLSKEQQREIVNQLEERQKGPWSELTDHEKKAAWYIAYGSWGPRKPIHGKGDVQKIVLGTTLGVGLGLLLFVITRVTAPDDVVSLNREWQEKSTEYLNSKNAEPFSGGVNYVQSK